MLRIWRPIQTQSPTQKDGSSRGVFVLMIIVGLFHVTAKELGTGHRCDRVIQTLLCLQIILHETCHCFTHTFNNFKLTSLVIFS